jgi:hypothetical protein
LRIAHAPKQLPDRFDPKICAPPENRKKKKRAAAVIFGLRITDTCLKMCI